jgi:hypothetical protein
VSEDVAEARARFLEASGTFEPLGVVRRHPFLSLGGAFAAGIGMNRLVKTAPYLSLLPVGVQIAGLAAKLGLLALDKSSK